MSDIKRTMPMGMNQGEGMEQPQQYMAQAASVAPKKSGWGGKITAIIVVIVVILIGLFLVSKYTSWNILNVNKGAVSSSGWKAVFLDNGQVYFGHVEKHSDKVLLLKEIYYLQVAQSPQPSPEGAAAAAQANNLSLVKLGNELHGPKDEMTINNQHILFTEDLKADSQVVSAIVRYVEDQKK